MGLISKSVDSVCVKVSKVNESPSKPRISVYKGKILI